MGEIENNEDYIIDSSKFFKDSDRSNWFTDENCKFNGFAEFSLLTVFPIINIIVYCFVIIVCIVKYCKLKQNNLPKRQKSKENQYKNERSEGDTETSEEKRKHEYVEYEPMNGEESKDPKNSRQIRQTQDRQDDQFSITNERIIKPALSPQSSQGSLIPPPSSYSTSAQSPTWNVQQTQQISQSSTLSQSLTKKISTQRNQNSLFNPNCILELQKKNKFQKKDSKRMSTEYENC